MKLKMNDMSFKKGKTLKIVMIKKSKKILIFFRNFVLK